MTRFSPVEIAPNDAGQGSACSATRKLASPRQDTIPCDLRTRRICHHQFFVFVTIFFTITFVIAIVIAVALATFLVHVTVIAGALVIVIVIVISIVTTIVGVVIVIINVSVSVIVIVIISLLLSLSSPLSLSSLLLSPFSMFVSVKRLFEAGGHMVQNPNNGEQKNVTRLHWEM